MSERMLTIPEIAAITTESEDTTRRRCAAGQIRAVKLGKKWVAAESEVALFLTPGKKASTRKRLTRRQQQQLGETA